MTDPSTDRERLVEHAYKDSRPLLARAGHLPVPARSGCDSSRWVLGQVEWPAGTRALDVGCGPGRYLAKLARDRTCGGRTSAWISRSAWPPRQASSQTSWSPTRSPAVRRRDLRRRHRRPHAVPRPDATSPWRSSRASLGPNGHALIVLNGEAHMQGDPRSAASRRCAISPEPTTVAARAEHRTLHDRDRLTRRGAVLRRRAVRATSNAIGRGPGRAAGGRLRRQHELFFAPFLPPDVTWARLMDACASASRRRSRRDGVWRTPKRRRLLRLPRRDRRARKKAESVPGDRLRGSARHTSRPGTIAAGSLARSSARRSARIASRSGSRRGARARSRRGSPPCSASVSALRALRTERYSGSIVTR